MEIFITWSGLRSRKVATALHTWLPKILNAFQPWMSSADLGAGSRWVEEVGKRLDSARAGIVCLTPGNLHEDWILFETGALAKAVPKTFVCPVLIDLEPNQVQFPLTQFQSVLLTHDGLLHLVRTLRTAVPVAEGMTEKHVDDMFELVWPKLENDISNLPEEKSAKAPDRSERDLLNELLELVRGIVRVESSPSIREWDTGMVSVAMDVANSMGLQVNAGGHSGTGDGRFTITLMGKAGKIYQVEAPVETTTAAFRALCARQLMKQKMDQSPL